MTSTPTSPPGALVIHGLTSTPASMQGLADAFAAAGFDVELPLLPGHGTVIEDLLPVRWGDWVAAVEAAYQRLAARVGERMVIAGLSLGGALTLRMGADHPQVAGLVCINPAAQPQPNETIELLSNLASGGVEVLPGIGSDIADPESKEVAYDGTPVRALLSLLLDGLAPLAKEYPQIKLPLLLLTSPQDHVVDPGQQEFLVARYGGPIERVVLERSYHVATQDYDKQLIFDSAVAFARQVTEA